ncbi:UvrD-helicase domain-containing protein [Actinopolymorpha sp. B9G3]|uniref:UvrD-helicase domain-containing protein n=1 Tax=Actinopolymorpha sp. B9G3 TaxID=3158970 RepID=UPI0032D989AC
MTSPAAATPLADAEARTRIVAALDETLFVEAGAGSGKTKSLVDRVVHTVLAGVPIENVAAVTFTEKAGAELRDRLRTEFEAAHRSAPDDVVRRQRADDALDGLDGTAIGTLHSFAQRILTAHPVEAGLPPLIEVLDEVGSSVAFEERWAEQRRALLDDDALARPLLLGLAAGLKLEHLRSLAKSFTADWDLVADRVLQGPEPAMPGLPSVEALVAQARRLADMAERCTDDTDKFLPRLDALSRWADRLAAAPDDPARLTCLTQAADLTWGYGRKANWGGGLDELKDSCRSLASEAKGHADTIVDAVLRTMARRIAADTVAAAETRRREGRLEFHDLLVLARNLLRSNTEVREALSERYQRLMLDEFQDTDPIQIELAVRIAGGAGAVADRWEDVDVPPGRLFVVGDPKQSIYRFRRADIATYLRTQARLGTGVRLSTNFRTTSAVLDWINAVFGQLITYTPDSQPAYQSLDPHRGQPPSGPPVTLLGATPHPARLSADQLREREAAEVAAVIRTAIAQRWQVWDDGSCGWRAVGLGDIAILVPARTSLPQLEDALDAAGVPYRAETTSLVYQAQEVRDLLASVRAINDPSDALALVAALRSPLFGCGDDDLWTWKQAGGVFNLLAPPPSGASDAHPVAAAIDYLLRLHRRARWMTPSELLGALVTDRRMLETAAGGPRMRDTWRRLRFVVDQARAWSEAEHGGLRAYLAWAGHQGDESSRVAEAVLPETDADAVRVMTIHAAKGLEFPMVVLSGMTSQPRGANGVQVLWPPTGGFAVKLGRGVQTGDFEAAQPVDEQMDQHERRRLLYVACTRARDHLVVSTHRCAQSTAETNAALLASAGNGVPAEWFVALDALAALPVAPPSFGPPPGWQDWRAHVTGVRQRAARSSSVSASGLEGTDPLVGPDQETLDPGLAKGARDLELPPWSKGRFGTAIGRAVHGVLQTIDLATDAGLDDAVAAQALAEGVVEESDLVAELARSALAADVVQVAARRPHWKETYVGTVVTGPSTARLAAALGTNTGDDEVVLEGFVDLIYRSDRGLVIVDYKTDAVPLGAINARVALYRPQMAAYVRCVEAATGQDVEYAVLVFLTPNGAYERRLARSELDDSPG